MGLLASAGGGGETASGLPGVRLWDLAALSLEDVLPHENEVGARVGASWETERGADAPERQ